MPLNTRLSARLAAATVVAASLAACATPPPPECPFPQMIDRAGSLLVQARGDVAKNDLAGGMAAVDGGLLAIGNTYWDGRSADDTVAALAQAEAILAQGDTARALALKLDLLNERIARAKIRAPNCVVAELIVG